MSDSQQTGTEKNKNGVLSEDYWNFEAKPPEQLNMDSEIDFCFLYGESVLALENCQFTAGSKKYKLAVILTEKRIALLKYKKDYSNLFLWIFVLLGATITASYFWGLKIGQLVLYTLFGSCTVHQQERRKDLKNFTIVQQIDFENIAQVKLRDLKELVIKLNSDETVSIKISKKSIPIFTDILEKNGHKAEY